MFEAKCLKHVLLSNKIKKRSQLKAILPPYLSVNFILLEVVQILTAIDSCDISIKICCQRQSIELQTST